VPIPGLIRPNPPMKPTDFAGGVSANDSPSLNQKDLSDQVFGCAM